MNAVNDCTSLHYNTPAETQHQHEMCCAGLWLCGWLDGWLAGWYSILMPDAMYTTCRIVKSSMPDTNYLIYVN